MQEERKAVLLSLRPEWLMPIIEGKKIYEVRKRAPALKTPYKVYVYCTLRQPMIHWNTKAFNGNLNGLVCAEFTCVNNIEINPPFHGKLEGTCLTDRQLAEYSSGEKLVFMEIENPKILVAPFELKKLGMNNAPQSWRYCKELENV